MQLDLILKDIQDPYTRENFFRLRKFVDKQVIFDGDFKLFDITVPSKNQKFKVNHGLTFIPVDIISLSASGDLNYYFKYQDFDKEAMYIATDGPVRLRFLAGKLKDPTSSNLVSPFPFVAPGDIVGPSSPGFVYGAVGVKSTGFWLTSEGVPSNVVGIPVLFGDAVVSMAAVGTAAESNYTIGVYQHEGSGINLIQLGTFNVISGGAKRVSVNFPVQYTSPNVQLACRLVLGNTDSLKVSLIVKGTAV